MSFYFSTHNNHTEWLLLTKERVEKTFKNILKESFFLSFHFFQQKSLSSYIGNCFMERRIAFLIFLCHTRTGLDEWKFMLFVKTQSFPKNFCISALIEHLTCNLMGCTIFKIIWLAEIMQNLDQHLRQKIFATLINC